jgi:enoyl-[acyl-carrier protein] reductase III
MEQRWALILGASSGFGEATARALAAEGYSIIGVHLDRRAALPHVQEVIAAIEAAGRTASFST